MSYGPYQPGNPCRMPPRRKRKSLRAVLRSVAGLSALIVIAGIAGCHSKATTAASSPATSGPAAAAATPRPAQTGFGATLAQWKAAHRLDVSVPARNAYLPHLDGEDTWQVVMVAGGRVNSYTLNVPASSLSSAEARARQELPADTRVLWARTVPGKCSQEQFESATLAAALGDGQVNVEFDNASSGNATPITEELFSTWDAPAVAQAPAC
jgi:hypothetical protein